MAAKKLYTGTFPQSPKSPKDFRENEIEKQDGFKGSHMPDTGFAAMRDDSAMDSFPSLKKGGSISNAGGGGDAGSVECDVNVGSDLAPTKHRPFGNYEPNTKPPKGRALPVRGEFGNTNNKVIR